MIHNFLPPLYSHFFILTSWLCHNLTITHWHHLAFRIKFGKVRKKYACQLKQCYLQMGFFYIKKWLFGVGVWMLNKTNSNTLKSEAVALNAFKFKIQEQQASQFRGMKARSFTNEWFMRKAVGDLSDLVRLTGTSNLRLSLEGTGSLKCYWLLWQSGKKGIALI